MKIIFVSLFLIIFVAFVINALLPIVFSFDNLPSAIVLSIMWFLSGIGVIVENRINFKKS